jgi:hypothetical protein
VHYKIIFRCYNVKLNTKRVLLSAAGLMLSAGNALAKTTDSGSTDMMDKAVNSLDPSVQPWAAIAVTLIRAGFVLAVGGGMLYYGGLYFLQKKQGHTTQASEARTSALNVFLMGVAAVILYNIFAVFVAGKIGM